MPHSYQINDDQRPVLEIPADRASLGLPSDGFIFCCFNATYKLSPTEFDLWMELLSRVEGSVLWLLAGSARAQSNLRAEAKARGVDPNRLVFAPKVKPEAHLARIQHADVFLDTFNCNAHTTASDALWAGQPLITKAGKGLAARVGASLLHAIGLDQLIVFSDRDYVEKALEMAQNGEKFAAVRETLQASRSTMPLFNSAMFTRHIELAYDAAYDLYLTGQPPTDIVVPT